MSDIHDAMTAVDMRDFELGINSIFNTFFYRTRHPLEEVLSPGYFDRAVSAQIRRHDRIEVVANCNGLLAEHATLAVKDLTEANSSARVVVSLLFCNK